MKQLLISGIILSLMSGVAISSEKKVWSASAELGGTMTTGNTDTSTLKAKIDATHRIINWENKYYADVLYSEDQENKTASRWKIGAQGNYIFDEVSGIFILTELEQDQFSDYDSITSAAAGYSRRIFSKESSVLDGAIGPGIKFFDLKNGSNEKTSILHLSITYENKLSETSIFTQRMTSDVAFEDEKSTLSRSETAITANVIGELAMKLGFIVRHDNQPGAGKEKIDTETTITLLYSF